MSYVYKVIDSPVGKLKLVASQEGLAAILWENENPNRVKLGTLVEDQNDPILLEAERQLDEYFDGKRKSFSLKLGAVGTQFQNDVWRVLLAIPFGETRSYGELARQLGKPRASRAVGAAIGRNPISIMVPCHRAIGASGQLTGFAGGLKTKAWLLELEKGVDGSEPHQSSAPPGRHTGAANQQQVQMPLRFSAAPEPKA